MKVLLVAALVVACAGTGYVAPEATPARTDSSAPTHVSERRVTDWTIWGSRSEVPRRYRHTIDWHTWPGPVLAAFANRSVCAFLFDVGAPNVVRGQLLVCAWQEPRGI